MVVTIAGADTAVGVVIMVVIVGHIERPGSIWVRVRVRRGVLMWKNMRRNKKSGDDDDLGGGGSTKSCHASPSNVRLWVPGWLSLPRSRSGGER